MKWEWEWDTHMHGMDGVTRLPLEASPWVWESISDAGVLFWAFDFFFI